MSKHVKTSQNIFSEFEMSDVEASETAFFEDKISQNRCSPKIESCLDIRLSGAIHAIPILSSSNASLLQLRTRDI